MMDGAEKFVVWSVLDVLVDLAQRLRLPSSPPETPVVVRVVGQPVRVNFAGKCAGSLCDRGRNGLSLGQQDVGIYSADYFHQSGSLLRPPTLLTHRDYRY